MDENVLAGYYERDLSLMPPEVTRTFSEALFGTFRDRGESSEDAAEGAGTTLESIERDEPEAVRALLTYARSNTGLVKEATSIFVEARPDLVCNLARRTAGRARRASMSEHRRRRLEEESGGGLPLFPLVLVVILAGLLMGGLLAHFLGGSKSVTRSAPTASQSCRHLPQHRRRFLHRLDRKQRRCRRPGNADATADGIPGSNGFASTHTNTFT